MTTGYARPTTAHCLASAYGYSQALRLRSDRSQLVTPGVQRTEYAHTMLSKAMMCVAKSLRAGTIGKKARQSLVSPLSIER